MFAIFKELMDFLKVIIPALAWPILLLIIFLSCKKQVRALLSALDAKLRSLQSVKVPGADIQFINDLKPSEGEIVDVPVEVINVEKKPVSH